MYLANLESMMSSVMNSVHWVNRVQVHLKSEIWGYSVRN